MTPPALLFAAAALVPAMSAPAEGLPLARNAGALIVGLCNGGAVALPFGNSGDPATPPCCYAKGCRASDKRRRMAGDARLGA